MAEIKVINSLKGINTYTNPFNTPDGNIIHCLNLDNFPYDGKTKRPGYITYLGTPDASAVNTLFSWTKNDGTTLFTYRASGSALYYSAQGTGAWTLAGNGTIANGAGVGYAVLENTLIIGDGSGTPKTTTDGMNFNYATSSPVGAQFFTDYQGRIYCNGTASNLFFCTTGTATDWTTDSSSYLIPGAGKLGKIFKASDRLLTTKNSGLMHRWDGVTLVDMATKFGPSSPWSVGEVEDYRFYLNRLGIFMTNGGVPQLISNPIRRQIYNDNNTGIAGGTFNTAPGEIHKYHYYLSAGTITDDFTMEQISDAIIVYDFQVNAFVNYKFAHFPTAYHSYKDATGVQQMIFGNASGQCYQLSGTATSDAGQPIEMNMVLLCHGDLPHIRKDFQRLEVYTNPGCSAKIQVAFEDTVIINRGGYPISGPKIWTEIGDLTKGYNYFSLPPGSRGNLMYIRIYEAGKNSRPAIYSIRYQFEPVNL